VVDAGQPAAFPTAVEAVLARGAKDMPRLTHRLAPCTSETFRLSVDVEASTMAVP
jgi:hypothetical protein